MSRAKAAVSSSLTMACPPSLMTTVRPWWRASHGRASPMDWALAMAGCMLAVAVIGTTPSVEDPGDGPGPMAGGRALENGTKTLGCAAGFWDGEYISARAVLVP